MEIKTFIKHNKYYIYVVIFIGILCYGFPISHFSMGVDDEAIQRFIIDGEVIQQGRVGLYILNKIIPLYGFVPFWRDLLATVCLVVSSILFSFMIFRESKKTFSGMIIIIFSGIMISNPVISEMYIFATYNLEISIGYMLCGIALLIFQDILEISSITKYLICIIVLAFTISIYESFATVFICGIFIIITLKYMDIDSDSDIIEIKSIIIKFIGIILLSILLNFIITNMIQYIMKMPNNNYKTNAFFIWKDNNTKSVITGLIIAYKSYFESNTFFKLFIYSCIMIFMVGIIISIKLKKIVVLISSIGIISSFFIIPVLTGNQMPWRTYQTMPIITAIGFVLFFMLLNNKNYKKICFLICMYIVLLHSKDINLSFYNDYQRYQMDLDLAKEINSRLIEECENRIIDKPVIFTGEYVQCDSINRKDPLGYNGYSIFGRDGTGVKSRRIYEFMDQHNFKYKRIEDSMIANSIIESSTMEIWPQDESVKEFEKYIIVKLGGPQVEIKKSNEANLLQNNNANIQYNIDYIECINDRLTLVGWGFLNGENSLYSEISIVLKSDKEYISLKNLQNKSVGLSKSVGDEFNNYENCAIRLYDYDISHLKKGKYTLGLYIKNNNRHAYVDLNNYILL